MNVNRMFSLIRIDRVALGAGLVVASIAAHAAPPTPDELDIPSIDYDGDVSIRWDRSYGAHYYDLERRVDGGSYGMVVRTSRRYHTDRNLSAGIYDYRVKACSYYTGCSGYIESLGMEIVEPPPRPAGFIIPAFDGDGIIDIVWNASNGATTYELQRAVSGGSYSNVYVGANISFTDSGLTNGVYDYRVRACDGLACSSWRENPDLEITLGGVTQTLPPTPANFSVPNYSTSGFIPLSWDPVSGPVGTVHYTLKKQKDGGGYFTTYANTSTSYTDSCPFGICIGVQTGLYDGTYDYQVSACNDLGCSAPAEKTGLIVVRAPIQPSNLIIPQSSNNGEAYIRWNRGIGPIIPSSYFELERRFDGGVYVQVFSGFPIFFDDSGLSNGTYDYRVRNCHAIDDCSDWIEETGLIVTLPPSRPENLYVPEFSDTGSVDIFWDASSGNVTSYDIERAKRALGNYVPVEEYTGGTSVTDSNLANNSTYDYRVRACDGSVCSNWNYETGLAISIASFVPSAPVSGLAENVVSTTEQNNTDQVGSIAGSFDVSASGAATYSVPIFAPQGTAGVTPQLSLGYSSSSGNGLLGIGWNLGGLSSITRCPQTLSQDGFPLPVKFDANDRFCLDGQRLLLESGSNYGDVGSTYRAQIDSFTEVSAVGGSAGDPSYFRVERKDGSVSYYGNTGDSSLDAASGTTRTWAINEFEDNVGNNIVYKYIDTPQGDGHMIDQIYWGNGENTTTASYNSRIKFNYGTRDDHQVSYLGAQLFSSKKRLTRIDVYGGSGSTQLRRYNLFYDESAQGANNPADKLSRLSSIEECVSGTGNSGVGCLEKTTFDWEVAEGGLALAGPSNLLSPSLGAVPAVGAKAYVFVDIDGDGIKDLVYQALGDIYYKLARRVSGSENKFEFVDGLFSDGTTSADGHQATYASLRAMDYNADGHMDIVHAFEDPYDGGSFIKVRLNVPHSSGTWRLSADDYLTLPVASWGGIFADMNGDGLTDVIGRYNSHLYEDHQSAIINLESNGSAVTSSTPFSFANWGDMNERFTENGTVTANKRRMTAYGVGDFNGDGLGDPISSINEDYNCYTPTYGCLGGPAVVFMSSEPASSYYDYQWDFISPLPSSINEIEGKVLTADFNRDGLTDLLSCKVGGNWLLQFSTAVGFTAYTDIGVTCLNNENQVIDFNGDGYPDLYWHDGAADRYKLKLWDPATNAFESTVQNIQVAGSDFVTTNYDLHSSFNDLDGDGRIEFIRATGSSITIYSDVDADDPKDKIVEITNGLGAKTEITYERIGETDHYATVQYKSSPSNSWSDSSSVSSVNALYTAINEDYDNRDSLITNNLYAEKHSIPVVSGPTVVTEVEQSMPTETSASALSSMSYYYGDALRGTGGSGIGGFGKRMVVDNQTGIETETTYRQDWPYSGRPIRTEVRTSSGALVSSQENTWTVRTQANAYSSSWQSTLTSNGSASLGPVAPYLDLSVQKTYDPYDGTSAVLSTVVTDADRDGYGNPELVTVRTYDGNQNDPTAGGYVTQVETDNKYSTTSYDLRFGRVYETVVKTTRGADISTRKVTFDYYDSDSTTNPGGDMAGTYHTYQGMLKSESVFLNSTDSSALTTSTYYYDTHGNRVLTSTGDGSETRYSALSTYESTGRYVDTLHELLADSSGDEIKRLISDVISRDAYGTPTETRSYVDTSTYLTSKSYTTDRGITYFSTDSTGAWTSSILAMGAGSYCPVGTAYHNEVGSAGGGGAYECFDILGRSIGKAAKSFDGTYAYTRTYFDASGRMAKTSEPSADLTPNIWTHQTYDDLGRPEDTSVPTAQSTPSVFANRIDYDALVTTYTNALGHKKKETRNVLGEIVRVDEGGTGANMSYSTYEYDASGNLVELRDAANNPTYIYYDNLGRKISMDDPDKGLWEYQYNAFGEQVCQEDAKGQIIESVYDFRGRLVERTDRQTGGDCDPATSAVPNGTVVGFSEWEYDQAGNGWGQLWQVRQFSDTSDSVADYKQTSYFDSLGRIDRTHTDIEGNTDDHWTKTTYDQYGRVFQSFDAARTSDAYTNNGIQNHYNSHGYLNKITDALHSNSTNQPLSTYYQVQAMDDRGNVTQASYGGQLSVYANYEADTGYLDWLSTKFGSTAYQNYDLTWDDAGNLEKRSNLTGNVAGSGSSIANETESYLYDGLNRLTTYTVNGSSTSVGYNNIGNITSKSDFGGAYSYTANHSQCAATPGPHAVRTANAQYYCYDDNGNMIKDGSGRDLIYSVFDKVTQIADGSHITTFDYGPSRDRYRRTDTTGSGTRTTLYLGSVEKVYDENGYTIQWKRNIAGIGQIVQEVSSAGEVQSESQSYFAKDHLGSITNILTIDDGTIAEERMAFDPWGARRDPGNLTNLPSANYSVLGTGTGPTTTRGFTGHEMLDDVDIIHMNGRIYDAKMARFVQADPIVQAPFSTASLNRYSYVWNNPMNARDPSGYTRSQGPDIYVNPQPGDDGSIDIRDWQDNYAYRYDTLMSDYQQGAWEDSYTRTVYDGYNWSAELGGSGNDPTEEMTSGLASTGVPTDIQLIAFRLMLDDGTGSRRTDDKFASGLTEILAVLGVTSSILAKSDGAIMHPHYVSMIAYGSAAPLKFGSATSSSALLAFSDIGKAISMRLSYAGVFIDTVNTISDVRESETPQEASRAIIRGTVNAEMGLVTGIWPIGTAVGGAYFGSLVIEDLYPGHGERALQNLAEYEINRRSYW